MAISAIPSHHLALAARVLAASVGGYGFTWGFVALGISALSVFDVDFHDAESITLITAIFVYLCLFLWAFCAPSFVRVCTVLGVGTILMVGGAWGLQQAILK